MTLTYEMMVAYASFLLSERDRHQEDIDMINAKLELIASKGIYPEGTGPWITNEEIAGIDTSIIRRRQDHGVFTER